MPVQAPTAQSRRSQRGLSVVELLVGVAVGLFLLGGATKLFVDYLGDSRRMLVETRVNQDLRAAADLLVRDLRRAGYWQGAMTGMVAPGAASAPLNPFRAINVSDNDLTVGQLTFSYDRAASAAESSGFRVRNGALQIFNGSWQSVTDPNVIRIDVAQLGAPVAREIPLHTSCACMSELTCSATDFALGGAHHSNRPRMTLRQYTLRLSGYAPGSTAVRREIQETVRVRNDAPEGWCPSV